MDSIQTGATIERGRVLSVQNGRAIIESITRPGIITMPLGVTGGVTVSQGDAVFYFEFEDGCGLMLGKDTAEQA